RAKGMSGGSVMTRHVLRNSLIPVATFIGADLGSLMTGAIVTEGIFGINGVGGTLYQAILRGEPTTIVSFTTVLVVIYIIANLLVDLLDAVLDPRIRSAEYRTQYMPPRTGRRKPGHQWEPCARSLQRVNR